MFYSIITIVHKVKYILPALLLLSALHFPSFGQDFNGVQGPLGDVFSSLVDSNEGLTIFRSLYIPSGGRAEAMGSAFTALANDISFFEYNPAASSTLTNTELAVFHNAWIADSAMETVAFSQRYKNLGYGAALKCFYVPFTEYNMFGSRVSRGYYSETVASLNLSYNFFAGYDFKGLAVGVNLKAGYRGVPDYADKNTDTVIPGSGLSQSAVALMADIGIQMRFNLFKNYFSRDPNLQIGLSLNNLGAALTGFGRPQGIELDNPLPTRLAAGVAYRPIRPLTVSLEFQQPLNIQDIRLSEKWAVGAGAMIQVTDFFAFAGGFLLRGANPRFSLGAEFQVMKIQMNVNYTLDLTSSINPVNRISLAAKINLGDRGRQKIQDEVDRLYTDGLQQYSLGNLDAAIDSWKSALYLDPHFDPAKKGIAAAQNTKLLQNRIKEIQVLD